MSMYENDLSGVSEEVNRHFERIATQEDEDETTTEEDGEITQENGDTNTETDDETEADGEEIAFQLNGEETSFNGDTEKPLLYVLRNDAELNGPKFGCGLAQCGACDVIVDEETVLSCVTPVSDVEGSEVTTSRGLGTRDDPHPVQQAFIDSQAAQCGYCIHGMVMEATALLEENPDPSDDEIRETLSENLCRCGTHGAILAAVRQAAEEMN